MRAMTYVLIRAVPAESKTKPITADRSAATTACAGGEISVTDARKK